MGWFKEDPAVADPQFAVKMGPNIVMETRGNVIPYSSDIKVKWTSKGTPGATEYPQKYWIIPRLPDGELSDYIRLGLDVNWRFINLNFSFKSVFGPTSRSLYVYSNVGSCSVLGDQVTDFIREVDYKREGRGTSSHRISPSRVTSKIRRLGSSARVFPIWRLVANSVGRQGSTGD